MFLKCHQHVCSHYLSLGKILKHPAKDCYLLKKNQPKTANSCSDLVGYSELGSSGFGKNHVSHDVEEKNVYIDVDSKHKSVVENCIQEADCVCDMQL